MKAATEAASARRRWYRTLRLWRRARADLPMNSDIEVARTVAGVSVMIRVRPRHLALVALGGALGTAARFVLTTVAPSWERLSAGTVAVNLLGPFMLGLLLQSLAQGAESRARRALRLLVGVGFLGAFTSYAQLTVDTIVVSANGHVLVAATYALVTIAAGAVAAWLGIFTASRWRTTAHA